MKKILIPIDASKEVPKKSGNYPTLIGISFTELYFDAKEKTWYCPLTPEDIPTNDEVIWYKEVTIDELLPNKKKRYETALIHGGTTKGNHIDSHQRGQNYIIDYIKQELER